MTLPLIFLILVAFLLIYIGFYFFLLSHLQKQEKAIVTLFLEKTSKIPAIIEVMRPSIVDFQAFESIVELHSRAMVLRYDTIYDLLEHNARIEHEFTFLMRLSMEVPHLQKDKYFLYIRDFIINYERDIRAGFADLNHAIDSWNRFISLKNKTIIGLLLPGSRRMHVRQ